MLVVCESVFVDLVTVIRADGLDVDGCGDGGGGGGYGGGEDVGADACGVVALVLFLMVLTKLGVISNVAMYFFGLAGCIKAGGIVEGFSW